MTMISKDTKNLLDSSSDEDSVSHCNRIPMENGFTGKNKPGPSYKNFSTDKPSSNKRKHAGGSVIEENAWKMMKGMGYQDGKGLGKTQQGIVEPIKRSDHMAKRGLGYIVDGLQIDSSAEWDQEKDYTQVKEELIWLSSQDEKPIDFEDMKEWLEFGQRSKKIDHETFFCDPDVVKGVVKNKAIFDSLDPKEMRHARSKANPFESIRNCFFQNRAAPKMANIDAAVEFLLTNPITEEKVNMVTQNEPFYFADVCAAPGGFSEYVLWRNKEMNKGLCKAKGFGFTLKENDFKLTDFISGAPEFFEPHYGKMGDGDIFKSENIRSFASFVNEYTCGRGVHLMMADGGFSVQGEECIQEILSKQLYLCQFLTALTILRTDGNFVCKLFDLFTPFSIGLIYLMYQSFKEISIFKPNSSRPANSERYLICKWKKKETKAICDYLFMVNSEIMKCKSSERDIISIVLFEIMQENKEFFEYIYTSNNNLGIRQIVALTKVQMFCKNNELLEDRQLHLKNKCIQYWQLPPKLRVKPISCPPEQILREIFKKQDVLNTNTINLNKVNLTTLRSRYDYEFVVLSSSTDKYKPERGFFYGMGGQRVYFFNVHENKWKSLQVKIELPRDTIVFAEIASEINPRGKTTALHLIDGILLNGFNISSLSIYQRHDILKIFAKTINRPTVTNITPIRCKELHPFKRIKEVLSPTRLIESEKKKIYRENFLENGDPLEVSPTGILLLTNTHRDWTIGYSMTARRLYYYNKINRKSLFEYTHKLWGCMEHSLANGYYWWWSSGTGSTRMDPNQLYMSDIVDHLALLPY